jgi:hypothetical protein
VLVADRLQHARIGREAGLAAPLARQAELDEQHLRELLRGADHELLPRQLPDLALELGGRGAHPPARLLESGGIELDARLLALAQDVDERQLDLAQQVLEAALAHLLALTARELMREHRARRLGVIGRDGHAALFAELVERVARRAGSSR